MEAIDREEFAECARGDPARAGSLLWRAFYGKLAALCAQYELPRELEAEDLAQEAIVKAMERARSYDPRWSVATWLYAIARNLALDKMRRGKAGPRECGSEAAEPRSGYPGPEDAAIAGEEKAFVGAFLARQSEEDRTLAFLHSAEGMGYAEISRILRRPEGTLKWRMSELRAALAREWEDAYGRT